MAQSSPKNQKVEKAFLLSGYAYAIVAAALWGIAGTIAKFLFNRDVTALALTQVRQTLSFLVMMAFFLAFRRNLARVALRDIPYLATLGILGLAMVQISYYVTISKIQVAAAILLQYMAPVFILIYSTTFMKEKLTLPKVAALLLAVTGCAFVAGIYRLDLLKLNLAGVAWGLLAALFFSFWTLYGQAGLKKYGAMTLFAYASGFGSIVWWILNPPRSFFSVHYSTLTWLGFLYIVLFGTVFPFVFYLKSLERLEASRVSITSTLEPVVAGVAAYLALGEQMDLLQALGGILVIAAIIVLRRSATSESMR